MEGTANKENTIADVIQSQHPEFWKILQEFKSFVASVSEDLTRKQLDLQEQRKLIQSKHNSVKNYLKCQIFMISRHQKRIKRLEEEVERRINVPASMIQDDYWEEFKAKLSGDLDKMKRRCKHMLDVTDRYCVLHREELKLKEDSIASMPRNTKEHRNSLGSITSSKSASSLQDCDEVDGIMRAKRCLSAASSRSTSFYSCTSEPNEAVNDLSMSINSSEGSTVMNQSNVSSDSSNDDSDNSRKSSNVSKVSNDSNWSNVSVPADRHLTDNMVKATLDSFLSHMSVITKTYTCKSANNFTLS